MMSRQGGYSILRKYLLPTCVRVTRETEPRAVIHELVMEAAKSGILEKPDDFEQAVLEREKIVSTGIGLGVAIPHAKRADQEDFFICCALAPEGIDWKALDGEPCYLIFLIGGPDQKPNEYLQILSQLTALLREDETRKQLLKSRTAEDILAILQGP